MSNKPLCPICMDPYTKQVHRTAVECTYCNVSACVRCIETYIENTIEDAHCFSCRRGWTCDFICEKMPKTWYNGDFKKKRESILMDRERSRLPVSQGWAERIRRAVSVYKPTAAKAYEHLKEVRIEYNELLYEKDRMDRELSKIMKNKDESEKEKKKHRKNYRNELAILKEKINEKKNEKQLLERRHRENNYLYTNSMNLSDDEYNRRLNVEDIRAQVRLENPDVDVETENTLIDSILLTLEKPNERKKVFTMKCPGNDCLGFLNTSYNCGLCERKTCAGCLVQHTEEDPKGDRHVCKEDDKASLELIKKSCKNCPSCGMSIFRIEGCSQMFCTACNTAFDWTSGAKLVTKQIHNPHYTEYMTRMGLAPNSGERHHEVGANPCGNTANISSFIGNCIIPIHNFLKIYYGRDIGNNNLKIIKRLSEYSRLVLHIHEVDIPAYNRELTLNSDNVKTNALYLAGVSSASQWKRDLLTNETIRISYNEALQTMQAYTTICNDIYGNLRIEYDQIFSEEDRELLSNNRYTSINTSFTGKIKKIGEFLNRNKEKIYEKYEKLDSQIQQAIKIYNEKMESLIKIYKIPMHIIEERTSILEPSTCWYGSVQHSYNYYYGTGGLYSIVKPRAK